MTRDVWEGFNKALLVEVIRSHEALHAGKEAHFDEAGENSPIMAT